MALESFRVIRSEPYAGGKSFGDVGAFQQVDAIAGYRVDPGHPDNARIVDLASVPVDDDGCVRFTGDVTLLLPDEPARGNGAVLVEAPNRGNRIALRSFNRAPQDLASTAALHPGDGFLFRHGFCVAFCGWQWDVPRSRERVGLEAPRAVDDGAGARMQLRLQPDRDSSHLPLTDQHVGQVGNHVPIPPGDPGDPEDRLLVRDGLLGEPRELPRSSWRFAVARGDDVVPDDHHVWLEGGFQAGRIYDLIYAPAALPVAGAGLLALRDFGAWLRRSPDSPVAGRVDHFLLEGQSQTGRALRHFLWLGLNADESGRPVYDGVLAHIAGARRGEFNQRHAQPSVQPTPGFGHLPPFDDAGLLERQRHAGGVPRIMFTDTSSEYWRGDASLTHLDGDAGGDLDPPPEVRRYLFASTQHGPGMPPFARLSIFGSHGANCFNLVDYRPLYRAALMNLLAWVADRREPPPSSVPRVDGGTAAERQAVLDALAAIPALALPAAGELPSLHPLDLGAGASRGIGTWPARVTGPARPCRVAAVDADGNERAGVAMPDVTVPVATHTGFNPRHPESGGAGQILEYMGSTLPFPVDEDARRATGDPRPSIAARYRDRDDYLARVREAADRLVAQHWLLPEDVAVCVDIAGARYDACLAGTPTDHD